MSIRRGRDDNRDGQGQEGARSMDDRSSMLGEIAAEAALERNAFLNDAGEQLKRFVDANKRRIHEAGGLVLIDDDPDYLSVAPDGTFRSRTRYQDEVTGEWHAETEIIESAAELVELYNPSEVFAAFAEAAREQAGMPHEPTATDDLLDAAGADTGERVGVTGAGGDDELGLEYNAPADDWAARRDDNEPLDAEDAARRLYDIALTFQERSQHSEARLIEQFQTATASLAPLLGDLLILDDEDERLYFKSNGAFEAEVVPEEDDEGADSAADGEWRRLSTPDEIVEFYDPTDVFGDFAEALAEHFPAVDQDGDEADDEAEDEDEDADEDDASDEDDHDH
jgi:hypothetical protein